MTKDDATKILDLIKEIVFSAIDLCKNVDIVMDGGIKEDGHEQVDGIKWKKWASDGSFSATIKIPKDCTNG